MKVLLFGHIGRGNIGDDLMAQSILHLLEERGYKKIRILSNKGINDKYRYFKEGVMNYFKNILWADVIILNGGNYLHDKSNNLRFLFSPFIKIGGVAILSLLLRRKFIMTGQGFGPFRSKLAEYGTRLIARSAHYISVRDEFSYELLKGRSSLYYVQDSVFMLRQNVVKAHDKRILGINLIQWGKVYRNDTLLDTELAGKVARILKQIENKFDEILFFSFNEKSSESDEVMYKLLKSCYKCQIPMSLVNYTDIEGFRSEFRKISVFFGMRFHGHVLALLERIPVISIPYHSKCEHIMKEFGIEEQSVLLEKILRKDIDISHMIYGLRIPEDPNIEDIRDKYLPHRL